jgi:uncharacterized damage-inducible protein DinB
VTDAPDDARTEPAFGLGEAEMLSAFLDYHRTTLTMKVAGLTQDQMAQPIETSSLTLGGLVKHMALVEDSWFTERFAGRPMPAPFADIDWDSDPDWEFRTAAGDTPEWLVQRYDEACDRSRAVVASAGSLDELAVAGRSKSGEVFTLRWILLHMIEESARHNGHADLLREAIDGLTGE